MTLAFLTNGCNQGIIMLQSLVDYGYTPSLVILERPQPAQNYVPRKTIEIFRQKVISLLTLYFIHTRIERKRRKPRLDIRELINKNNLKCVEVDNHNNEETTLYLEKLKPDIIILGGARIIKSNILNKAKFGTINVHPGLLPYYRGQSTVAWALKNHHVPSFTAHFVDEGIDTGAIILSVPIEASYKNVYQAREIVESHAGTVLIKALNKITSPSYHKAEKDERLFKKYMPMPGAQQLFLSATIYGKYLGNKIMQRIRGIL